MISLGTLNPSAFFLGQIPVKEMWLGNSKVWPSWTNPYVTDGLIHMWDGEWNASPGIHETQSSVWKDLVGDCDAQTAPSLVFDNYMYEDGSGQQKSLTTASKINFNLFKYLTFEACCTQIVDSTAWHMVIGSNTDYFSWGYSSMNGNTLTWKLGSGSRPGVTGKSGTFCGTYNNGVAALWRNGVKGTQYTSASNWSNTMFLTWANSWNSRRGTKRCHCYRLYNRVLTPEEIAANYAVDKARFGLP